MIIITIALIAICIFASHIWQEISKYKEAEDEYETIKENYTEEEPDPAAETDPGYPELDIDTNELMKINEDYIAWFYLEDLDISLPVVKEKEDEINKYIKTTFEGTKNASGCLFISYDADSNFEDTNTFIYGHNMANRSMFGSLKTMYNNPESIENPYFYIYLKNGKVKKYRVIAVVKTPSQSSLYHVPTVGDDYSSYLENALNAGRFDSYVAFTKEEEKAMENQSDLVTLSTCYGRSGSGQRLLVIGLELPLL